MGEDLQIFDIVLFAVITVVLGFWLRNALGRRTGREQYRDPFARRPGAPGQAGQNPAGSNPTGPQTPSGQAHDPIAPFPAAGPALNGAASPAPEPAADLIQKLKSADRNFDPAVFLRGARGAFEIVVNAFAAGDTATLKPLLSDEVYHSFAEAIAHRQAAKETLETTLVTVKTCQLIEGEVAGTMMSATVKFVSEQVHVTRAADGTVVDGEPDRVVDKTDSWTFSRDARSRNPNWLLVATSSV